VKINLSESFVRGFSVSEPAPGQGRPFRERQAASRPQRGFSMIESVVTVAIIMILLAAVVPIVQASVRIYQLRAAVAGVRSSIQAARYRAIADGYPYQLVLNAAAGTAQLQSNPNFAVTPATYANVGAATPLGGTSVAAALSADTTLQFRPGGLVIPVVGGNAFTISMYGSNKTFTVSTYGNVNVQ
jgi:prepilin-type N-terminal cleavage/methylation domain-containing protein